MTIAKVKRKFKKNVIHECETAAAFTSDRKCAEVSCCTGAICDNAVIFPGVLRLNVIDAEANAHSHVVCHSICLYLQLCRIDTQAYATMFCSHNSHDSELTWKEHIDHLH